MLLQLLRLLPMLCLLLSLHPLGRRHPLIRVQHFDLLLVLPHGLMHARLDLSGVVEVIGCLSLLLDERVNGVLDEVALENVGHLGPPVNVLVHKAVDQSLQV